MAERGEVRAVAWQPLGSELSADVVVGALQLTVDNPVDFDEDGGNVNLNDVGYEYTTIDQDTGIITLASAITTAGVAGDRVNVVSGGQIAIDYIAYVSVGDGDEVEVPIPYEQRDIWPEGEYDDPILVNLSDDLEVLLGVPGRTPIRDGSFIDPDTLPTPPGGGSDGLAPTGTLTLTLSPLGIGSLIAEWNALVNNDPVSYAVHLSLVQGFTPDATTLVETVVAQESLTIASGAAGVPLVYGTTYYARVIASDVDGPGPTSNEASGAPRQITGTDFSADEIYAMKIEAESIQSGRMTADIVVGGSFKTAETGQRVEIDGENGLINYGPDNVPRVVLPTGGDDPAVLRGVAELDTVTVHGMAEFQAGAHVTKGQDLVLDAAVQPPVGQPDLTQTYDTMTLTNVQAGTAFYGLWFHAGSWWTINVDGCKLVNFDTNGVGLSSHNLGVQSGDDQLRGLFGLAHVGSSWYVCGYKVPYQEQVRKYSDTTFAEQDRWNFSLAPSSNSFPCMAYQSFSNQFIIVKTNTSGEIVYQIYNLTGTASGGGVITVSGITPGKADLLGACQSQFDFGAGVTRTLVGHLGVDRAICLSGGTYENSRSFPLPSNIQGMNWDGANLWSLSNYQMRKYTNIRSSTAGDTYALQAAATYRDSVNGYETSRSSARAITLNKRSKYRCSVGFFPPGVDSVRFHISTDNGATFGTCTPTPNVGAISREYDTLTTSGVPPTASTFPAEASARVLAGSQTLLEGDRYGTFSPGDLKMCAYAATSGVPINDGGQWLLCDGALVDKTVFGRLFNKIGHLFNGGVDPGSNKFKLPDFRSRMPFGGGTFAALGENEGITSEASRTTQHTHGPGSYAADSNSHSHGAGTLATGASNLQGDRGSGTTATPSTAHGHNISGSTAGDSHGHGVSGTGGNVTGGAKSNVPYLGINFLIKT